MKSESISKTLFVVVLAKGRCEALRNGGIGFGIALLQYKGSTLGTYRYSMTAEEDTGEIVENLDSLARLRDVMAEVKEQERTLSSMQGDVLTTDLD